MHILNLSQLCCVRALKTRQEGQFSTRRVMFGANWLEKNRTVCAGITLLQGFILQY